MPPENQFFNQPPIGLGPHLLAAARGDSSWIVRMADQTQRRMTTEEVVTAYNARHLDADSFVWNEKTSAWRQLQDVDELVDALHAEAARSVPAPAPREDSAIFSLATLASEVRGSRPAQASEARDDDSGLIDLKGLAASMQATEISTTPLAAPDLFPITVMQAPPAQAPAAPATSQRPLVLGLVAAVMLLSALLAFQIVRSAESKPAAGEQPVAMLAPAETATAREPTAAPVPVAAQPVAEEKPAVVEEQPPAPAEAAAPPLPTPRINPTPVKSAKPVPTTPVVTNKACPCKPDDLQCNMRCAVK